MDYKLIKTAKSILFWAIPIIGTTGLVYVDFNSNLRIPLPNILLIDTIREILTGAKPIFLAILIESFPFVILGALLSSLIQEFVSVDALCRYIPKSHFLSVLIGGLLGVVVPICDCGTIPIARSLLNKDVPKPTVVAFTLAAPVVNPITLAATFVAFGLNVHITMLRGLLTYCIACIVGYLTVDHKKVGKRQTSSFVPSHTPRKNRSSAGGYLKRTWQHINHTVEHTTKELFAIAGFLILSAAVASVYQTYHAHHVHYGTVHSHIMAVATMMLLAILFSLCSEADAFVAMSFLNSYSLGSVMSFMMIGQMVDLRNLFLLPRTFGRRTATATIVGCLSLVFLTGIVITGLR
ncbi:permease [Alicyclobacillus fastidiosus]|uniref:Permease n=1 Tax=Alicyclobacillus fastidiosus TaxID=392011 RepID=A0ABV5ALQ0_9BACL|nr:permease [Alicyclobacillus fastidiosus]WEH11095.1 permease [Alicyclobacillus fastidiosus]